MIFVFLHQLKIYVSLQAVEKHGVDQIRPVVQIGQGNLIYFRADPNKKISKGEETSMIDPEGKILLLFDFPKQSGGKKST